MPKHSSYYRTLAIQYEINLLHALISAAGPEPTSFKNANGTEIKRMRNPDGTLGGSVKKGGTSESDDAEAESEGAGPIPQTLKSPKEQNKLLEAISKSPGEAINGIKERLKKIPASLSVPAEKVNKHFKEATAGVSAQLEEEGKTDMAKAVKEQASSMAKSIGEMKTVTAKKLGELAGSDAAKMTGAFALTFAASVAGLAIGGRSQAQ